MRLNYRGRMLYHPSGVVVVPSHTINDLYWECVVVFGNDDYPVGRQNLYISDSVLRTLATVELYDLPSLVSEKL